MPRTKDSPATKAMRRLTQRDAAWLLSITDRGLRGHDAPRNPDGTYDARKLVAWRIAQQAAAAADGDELLAGAASPALEEYRRHRAALAKLDVDERTGKLVDIDALAEWWESEVAGPIRRGIEALAAQYGDAAAELISGRLRKAEAAVAKRVSDE